MEYFEEIYYDSHVKAHERYLLIQMLENGKNEKIKKLREEATPVPTKKVNVPKPDIESGSLNYNQVFDSKLLYVSDCLIEATEQKAVSFKPTVDFSVLAERLRSNTVIPESSSLDVKPTISSEIFEKIELADVLIPDSSIDTNMTVDFEAFDSIMTGEKLDIPEKADISKPFTIPDDFGISALNVSIDQSINIESVVYVNDDSFKNIKTVKAEQLDLQNNIDKSLVQIDKTRFEGIVPEISDRIEMPIIKETAFDKSSLNTFSLKKINVPEKPKETAINIDDKLFSNVLSAAAAVMPRKAEFNTDLSALKPDISVNCTFEVPKQADISINPTMPMVDVQKIDTEKLLNKVEAADSLKGIEMPSVKVGNVEIPKAPVLPKTGMIEKTSFSVPKVTKPEKIQVPKIGEAAKLNINIPEKIEIDNTAKRVSDFTVPVMNYSISSVKAVISDNSDILEVASKEKTMYSNP